VDITSGHQVDTKGSRTQRRSKLGGGEAGSWRRLSDWRWER
jgi:hypothetical protein